MKIQQLGLTVRELVAGYHDDGDSGVVGYGGALDIRPPFQREFIYDEKERNAVINSILKGFPLNIMYWADREDGTYEIIDGQQRTISIAQYVAEKPGFSFKGLGFDNQQSDIKEKILNYELMVYVCSGTDSEKLEWFEIINIAGKQLSNQELLNAIYSGPWVTNAKRYFSKRGCPAYQIGRDYLRNSVKVERQEYLETAIKWISENGIKEYMRTHQYKESAALLWEYFQAVIDWINAIFRTYRNSMKGVDWGGLYNKYKDCEIDPVKIEAEVEILLDDEEVQRESGIYPYILTREEKHLNLRAFDARMKRRFYRKQNGVCALCKEEFDISEMEADHKKPWSEGGKTIEENCQMLCRRCNREKSSK
ncbi:MAG: DUF262 domain-containing protein [Chloroflexota bacterium]|nr:DUF262 domain-containing protein [Chloroflexota bacterium]MDE2950510.1 DUF262 domain-containing protein [Chloroflexota bacterium]